MTVDIDMIMTQTLKKMEKKESCEYRRKIAKDKTLVVDFCFEYCDTLGENVLVETHVSVIKEGKMIEDTIVNHVTGDFKDTLRDSIVYAIKCVLPNSDIK